MGFRIEHYHINTSKSRKSNFSKCPSKDCCLPEAYDENGQPVQG